MCGKYKAGDCCREQASGKTTLEEVMMYRVF